ncbi:MAG: hypothetical protein K2M30_00060, partial [Desulfovibrionaceae bacterium]|nr:hypothetical protein [Desulfovibrionaceae bacterium]
LSHTLTRANNISAIFIASTSLSSDVTHRQKKILNTYASMTDEEIEEQASQILNETSKSCGILPSAFSNPITYPECAEIFSHIESILYHDTSSYKPIAFSKEYIPFLKECGVKEEYIESLSLLLGYIQEQGIVKGYSIEEHAEFVQRVVKECSDLLQVKAPIFYAILTDTIKKHHTLQDISTLLSYCSTVIDIAKQERLQTGTAMLEKERCIHEEHTTLLSEASHSGLSSMGYGHYLQQIQ